MVQIGVFAALAASFFCFGCVREPVREQTDWDRLPDDAGMRMYVYAEELSKIAPRDAGTPGAARASRYIAQEIKRMGLNPVADCWTESTAFGRRTFCNVYVEFPGDTDQLVIIGSHYDTKSGIPDFKGANDGASSSAVLLCLIEHFAENNIKLHETVRFAFFDGEEAAGSAYQTGDGLHGSLHMAAEFPQFVPSGDKRKKPEVLAAIVLDMVGDRNLSIDIPRNVSPWIGKAAIKASLERKDCPVVTLADTSIIDDHISFINQGFHAIDLIDFEYGSAPGKHDYWHTGEDTIDKLSASSLYKSASLTLALMSRINDGLEVPMELRKFKSQTEK